MASYTQASTPDVVGAGYVRIAELGKELAFLYQNNQPIKQVAYSIIDLRQKLEAIGLTTDATELATLKAYVQETYDLLGVYTDPILRPLLPAIPSTGAELAAKILVVNGKNLVVNGKYVRMGYQLVPTPLLDDTTLPPAPVTTEPAPSYTPPTPVPTPYQQVFVNTSRVEVQHYLGRLALFQLFDQQGQELEGAVESSDSQHITVVFSQPLSGAIVLY